MTAKKKSARKYTRKALTHLICILDKSGSMATLTADTVGGFNAFLTEQKKVSGRALLSLALFDTEYRMVWHRVPLETAPELTVDMYRPQGGTALYDAIGKTLSGERITGHGGHAVDKVVCCIITDGEENSSHQWNNTAVRALIKTCEESGWEFVYLGANQDAFAVASSMGLRHNTVATFEPQGAGLRGAFASASAYAGGSRVMGANFVADVAKDPEWMAKLYRVEKAKADKKP